MKRNKLTVIDKLTIIGFAAISLFFALFFFKKTNFLQVEILVTHDNLLYSDSAPPFWYQEKITVGSQEKNSIGKVIAEVEDIKSYEDYQNKKDTYVRAKINVNFNSRSGEYSFRGQTLTVGAPIIISPGKVMIKGIITNIADFDQDLDQITVKVRTSGWNYPELTANGIDPIYINSIKVGDVVKDASGKIIAEVIDKEVYPGKRITYDSFGNARLVQDPYFKECYLTLHLWVRKTNSANYYMNKYKVKTSESLPLFFENTTQRVEVIEIL